MQRVAAGLLQLLGEATPLDEIDPVNARTEVSRSVLAFLCGLARQGPLVLVIGNVHWADAEVLELLDRVLTELGTQAFALFTTARPTDVARPAVVPGRHNSMLLRLDPLDRGAADELVRTLLGRDVDPVLVDELLERSGGNPLFLEELASLVQDSGHVGELPDSLRGLVAARLDELSVDERNMLENAAVLGPSGTWGGLAAFGAALHQPTVRSTFTALASRELLDVDGEEWVFRSESVREVAYQTLTKVARAQRHAGVADAIRRGHPEEVEAVAHHYAASAELVHELHHVAGVPRDIDDLAVEWLTRAAEHDLEQLLYPALARHADHALDLLDAAGAPVEDERRLRLLLVRGQGRVDAHDLDGARTDAAIVADVADRVGDRGLGARARALLGYIAQAGQQYDTADREYAVAVRVLRELGDEPALAAALRSWGMSSVLGSRFDQAETLLDEADALFDKAGDRRGHAWVEQHRAWIAFMRGDLDLADARLHAAAATFEEMGDEGGLGWTMGLLAWVRYQQGRLAESEALAADVAREAGLRGERWARAMMWVLLAGLRLWRGQADAALALAKQAHEEFRELNDRWGELQSLVPITRALAALGRTVEADQAAEGAEALGVRTAMPSLGATVVAGVAAHLGRGSQAVTAGRLAHEYLAEQDMGDLGLDADVALALGHLQEGQIEEATTALARWIERSPTHPYLSAAWALVLAAGGEPAAAAEVAARVVQSPGASYLDRQTASAALGLAAAQLGDALETKRVLTNGVAVVDQTDDRVAQALARLALAIGLEAVGSDATAAEADARQRLQALDLPAAGWVTAFRLAAGADRLTSGAAPSA